MAIAGPCGDRRRTPPGYGSSSGHAGSAQVGLPLRWVRWRWPPRCRSRRIGPPRHRRGGPGGARPQGLRAGGPHLGRAPAPRVPCPTPTGPGGRPRQSVAGRPRHWCAAHGSTGEPRIRPPEVTGVASGVRHQWPDARRPAESPGSTNRCGRWPPPDHPQPTGAETLKWPPARPQRNRRSGGRRPGSHRYQIAPARGCFAPSSCGVVAIRPRPDGFPRDLAPDSRRSQLDDAGFGVCRLLGGPRPKSPLPPAPSRRSSDPGSDRSVRR